MANTSTTQHTGNQIAATVTPETLPALTHKGKPVVTTALLAKLYGTEEANLQRNFQRNAGRFEEGKHYHRLEGAELKAFKGYATDSRVVEVSAQARHLTLWTERGAARHAKMLDTEAAWEVFEVLEDCYFSNAGPETLQTITDTCSQVAFEGCRIRVWLRDGQPWFAAANVATALGLPSSDRITRSAHPNDVCRTMKGKQATNYMSQQLARRAADYAKPELGERWLVWLQRTLAELAGQPVSSPAPQADPASLLRAVLAGNRFICCLDEMGRITMREIPPSAVLANVERLPEWIADPAGPPAHVLPGILAAVADRMRCPA